jgi:hypothetical protein
MESHAAQHLHKLAIAPDLVLLLSLLLLLLMWLVLTVAEWMAEHAVGGKVGNSCDKMRIGLTTF